jgi:opacity protein-like surface antigen
MGGWRRVHAGLVLAAALGVVCVGATAGTLTGGDDGDAHLILFSGRDLWLNGVFLYGGLLWSPDGLDSPGFTLKALISGGLYRYDAGDLGGARVDGSQISAALMPGWRFKQGPAELKIFLGPEIQRNRLNPDDPGNHLSGDKAGARFAVEVWNEPTPQTMAALDASLSTIATDYSARAAFGWRVLDEFYAGPETQVYGGDGYRQWRLGIHVTSFKDGDNEWSAAGGLALDSDHRASPYVRLGFMTRR